eukprot:c12146_g1_i1 orf=195-509(+)
MEKTDATAGIEVPGSPEATYDNPFPKLEDESKEPPSVPPHLLQRSLLNVQQDEYGSSISKPPHVLLNHLYIENGEIAKSVLALGLTHRFRAKYVTVVLYKPIPR